MLCLQTVSAQEVKAHNIFERTLVLKGVLVTAILPEIKQNIQTGDRTIVGPRPE